MPLTTEEFKEIIGNIFIEERRKARVELEESTHNKKVVWKPVKDHEFNPAEYLKGATQMSE